MIEQQAHAVWRGALKEGSGSFSSGSLSDRYSFSSRFEGGIGSSPEELIGAALASCFSMALALFLGGHGHTPVTIETTATVYLDPKRLVIARIELETEADVPALSDSAFQKIAVQAKKNCPVSKALAGVEILLKSAKLTPVAAERA
jgi:osmotically inducible protein OsmC